MIIKRVPTYPTVNILHCYGPFVTNNELIPIPYYSLNFIIWTSLMFLWPPLSVPRSHPIYHITISLLSLGNSWLLQFLRLRLFFMAWQLRGILVGSVSVCLPVRASLMFCSGSGWGCEFAGGWKVLSHPIVSRAQATTRTHHWRSWPWSHLTLQCSLDSSATKLLFSSTLHIL